MRRCLIVAVAPVVEVLVVVLAVYRHYLATEDSVVTMMAASAMTSFAN